jgi:hypothetical protein
VRPAASSHASSFAVSFPKPKRKNISFSVGNCGNSVSLIIQHECISGHLLNRKVETKKETYNTNNDGDSSVRQPGVICINFHLENIPRPFEKNKKEGEKIRKIFFVIF